MGGLIKMKEILERDFIKDEKGVYRMEIYKGAEKWTKFCIYPPTMTMHIEFEEEGGMRRMLENGYNATEEDFIETYNEMLKRKDAK